MILHQKYAIFTSQRMLTMTCQFYIERLQWLYRAVKKEMYEDFFKHAVILAALKNPFKDNLNSFC